MQTETKDDLQVYVNFRTQRHSGLVIVWPIGSNKLHLMRLGGPNGTYKMQTKTHASYKASEAAHAAAKRWFHLLDKVYATNEEVSQEVTSGA